jgi:hypothetical protein
MPFGTWYLTIFDVIRILCVISCLVLIGRISVQWQRAYAHGGQRARYLALGLFAFIVIATELENLGNIASYRLFLSLVAVLVANWGLRMSRAERPSAPG